MSSITETKINNIYVEVLKPLEEFRSDNVVGYEYFVNPYSNIFICAKKNSGKSMLIYNILKNTIDKNTKVIIFCGSVKKDNTYTEIIKYLKKKGNEVKTYNHFIENGVDLLSELMKKLNKSMEVEKEKENDEVNKMLFEDVNGKRPKRKPKKKIAPEFMLIFDDLGNTLRHQSVATFVKLNRHFKSKVIISHHSASDLYPTSIQQADFFILFGGYPEEKLENLHKHLNLSVYYEDFKKLYDYATKVKYDFLYCDSRNNKYRKCFNTELCL